MTQSRCTNRLPAPRSTRSHRISGLTATPYALGLVLFGNGTKTNDAGEKVASPVAATNSERTCAQALSDAERIRLLELENATLREEREILCRAAKYFAEETNW